MFLQPFSISDIRIAKAIAELVKPGESLPMRLAGQTTTAELLMTAPWHDADVPRDKPRYDAKFPCNASPTNCLVAEINEFKPTLQNKSKCVEDRRSPRGSSSIVSRTCTSWVMSATTTTTAGIKSSSGSSTEGTHMHARWGSGMIGRVSK
jgi:hypothetical protein